MSKANLYFAEVPELIVLADEFVNEIVEGNNMEQVSQILNVAADFRFRWASVYTEHAAQLVSHPAIGALFNELVTQYESAVLVFYRTAREKGLVEEDDLALNEEGRFEYENLRKFLGAEFSIRFQLREKMQMTLEDYAASKEISLDRALFNLQCML